MSVLRKYIHLFLNASLLVVSMLVLSAQSPANREYKVKAVFLFNFTQFIEWPPQTFSTTQSPLVIGILGSNVFGSYLNWTVVGEKVHGHPLVIEHYQNIDDVKTCHILFINRIEANIGQIISNLQGRSILTVSDAPDFIQKGGMIRFMTVNNRIKLQINPEAAKAAGLTISSKLLSLAEIVVPNEKNK